MLIIISKALNSAHLQIHKGLLNRFYPKLLMSILSDSSDLIEQKVIKISNEKNGVISEKIKTKNFSKNKKIKELHLECLKKYLNEDKCIRPAKAMSRLREETGLEVSTETLRYTLAKLREEMGQEYANMYSSAVRDRQSDQRYILKDMHLECLKKYLKEDKYIGPTKAMKKLHEETGLNVAVNTIGITLKNLRKEMGPEYYDLDSTLVKNKRLNDRIKLRSLHLKSLEKYLKEDKYLTPAKAMRKLREETGLEISIETLRKALAKLREEMGPEYVNMYSSTLKNITSNNRSRMRGLHLECLKKYLKENIYIGSIEARNRLYDETGLWISRNTVRNALEKLEHEITQDCMETPSPESVAKADFRARSYGYKLKDLHMECLKKYIIENFNMNTIEAKNRLYKETGYVVSIPTIKNALNEIREQDCIENGSLPSTTSDSKAMARSWIYGFKLKELHIDRLKSYLKEDNSIGATKAWNRLYKETGLEASVRPVQAALIMLKKEIEKERNEPLLPTLELDDKNESQKFGYKIKHIHIECLKKYLSEDSSIGSTKASNRLYIETGSKISASHISKVLRQLRNNDQ